MLAAVRSGGVALANAPGNGVGDDKAIYAMVPEFIRFYLGEEPLLEGVPTYICANPVALEEVFDRLGELVLKPVDGYGGAGVTIGPDASAAELDALREQVLLAPSRWVAQDVVKLSTHPTLVGGDAGAAKRRPSRLRRAQPRPEPGVRRTCRPRRSRGWRRPEA